MLKIEQILDLLKNVPEGFLKPDDDFFVPSNTTTLPMYKKLGAMNSEGIESMDEKITDNANEIFCSALNCNLVFDNVASYQSHYNSMHRFTCSECKKSLPTEHLLDLHISEYHDSYFQARLERGERLYKCYVEECKDHLFINPSERKDHCIEQHRFPANYRFDMPHRKNTGAVPKKLPKIKPADGMEVEDKEPKNKRKVNVLPHMFSFGHQKERTFKSNSPPEQNSKALDNLDALKEALSTL